MLNFCESANPKLPETGGFTSILLINRWLRFYIIYIEKHLNIWLLAEKCLILQRFFAPIGRKMTSKRLILWAFNGDFRKGAN
jgi:hypothetical protein